MWSSNWKLFIFLKQLIAGKRANSTGSIFCLIETHEAVSCTVQFPRNLMHEANVCVTSFTSAPILPPECAPAQNSLQLLIIRYGNYWRTQDIVQCSIVITLSTTASCVGRMSFEEQKKNCRTYVLKNVQTLPVSKFGRDNKSKRHKSDHNRKDQMENYKREALAGLPCSFTWRYD